MKRTGPLKRTSRLRSGTPLKRGTKLNPVNAKRKASEFARTYHSRERVAWVKALPCAWCGGGPSDNAHVVGGGAGRKSDYTNVIPLCRDHHRAYDEHRAPFAAPAYRAAVALYAAYVEEKWQAHTAARRSA